VLLDLHPSHLSLRSLQGICKLHECKYHAQGYGKAGRARSPVCSSCCQYGNYG
jgi:hypothetical protein